MYKGSRQISWRCSTIYKLCLFTQYRAICPTSFAYSMNYFIKIAAIICVSALSLPGFGQETSTGSIKGKVMDKFMEPCATGEIKCTRATTNTNGNFIISKVVKGMYQLAGNYAGYQEQILNNINEVKKKANSAISTLISQIRNTMHRYILIFLLSFSNGLR